MPSAMEAGSSSSSPSRGCRARGSPRSCSQQLASTPSTSPRQRGASCARRCRRHSGQSSRHPLTVSRPLYASGCPSSSRPASARSFQATRCSTACPSPWGGETGCRWLGRTARGRRRSCVRLPAKRHSREASWPFEGNSGVPARSASAARARSHAARIRPVRRARPARARGGAPPARTRDGWRSARRGHASTLRRRAGATRARGWLGVGERAARAAGLDSATRSRSAARDVLRRS